MTRKILIIGAGQVGASLGTAWLACGHDVRYGVSNPDDPKHAGLPRERLQSARERRDAEVVVLATPYPAARSALEALGDLSGAIVIDCTNPLGMGPEGLHLTVGFDTSGGEEIARFAPGASVFKTLNQTGAENMAHAAAFQPRSMMFVAGDDEARKPIVMELVADLGFESIDAGPLRAARLLEPLAMLWIDLVIKHGHPREMAFARLRRD
ncbi:NAD(P)-binding domain-containing protein [Bradyrhizobium manausense]|uniref:NADPH-dependent F420 reductase n=1 Tax=Bradyrhizobium manausense TaxID=989370 RepID=UPI001BA96050|nr:NAD(P)-binding domain-containing protein [Bradyrhizobium manausense]MBR1091469.1 NAD(P)-binding domain-containing protein [Bradyrhizobium manausense]